MLFEPGTPALALGTTLWFQFLSWFFFISVQCVQNPLTFYAKQLQKAMAGLGTNDTTLIRIIVSRCEIDLGNIKKEYERLHGKTLESVVKVCIVVYTTRDSLLVMFR